MTDVGEEVKADYANPSVGIDVVEFLSDELADLRLVDPLHL